MDRGAGRPAGEKAASEDTTGKAEGVLSAYLAKHALHPPRIAVPPHRTLGLIVAIPCHDEPALDATLADLWECEAPGMAVEVLVAVNAPADASPGVWERNQQTTGAARAFFTSRNSPQMMGHVLEYPDLPPRRAGVGLARKLAMDEAVSRLGRVGRPDGVLACLDADCRVPSTYLRAIAEHFTRHPRSPGAVLPFEHPLDGLNDAHVREGIVRYELHLRCMVLGLSLAGHPQAFHTVGSAMAVRAGAYARQGGMNQRRAGEDFHFLAKFFPLPGFGKVTGTVVWPAARASHRVPFGTGRALGAWLAGDAGGTCTYPLESYRLLAPLFSTPEEFHRLPQRDLKAWAGSQAPLLMECLEAEGFLDRIAEIQANTATARTFRERYFHWLNRFRVMKMQHFFRARGLEDCPSPEVARELLAWAGCATPEDPEALLASLRTLDHGPKEA